MTRQSWLAVRALLNRLPPLPIEGGEHRLLPLLGLVQRMRTDGARRMTPRDFLEHFAAPAVETHATAEACMVEHGRRDQDSPEFMSAVLAAKIATATAAVWTFHVHDWVWEFYGANTPQVLGAPSKSTYRKALVSRCSDFQVVNDIADAAKHMRLGDAARRPARFDELVTASFKWGEARWGEFAWGGGPQLVVHLDAQRKVGVKYALKQVLGMWRKLDEEGLL